MTFEVFRYRRLRLVVNFKAGFFQAFDINFKLLAVVRKQNDTVFVQQVCCSFYQPDVITLYIQCARHSLGVAERWWIQEDHIKCLLPSLLPHPAKAVSLATR